MGRQKEIANYYSLHAGQGAASLRSQVEQREPHEVYLRRYGIHQDREIYGNVIMLLGKAFREGGLPFGSAQDALDDLLRRQEGQIEEESHLMSSAVLQINVIPKRMLSLSEAAHHCGRSV